MTANPSFLSQRRKPYTHFSALGCPPFWGPLNLRVAQPLMFDAFCLHHRIVDALFILKWSAAACLLLSLVNSTTHHRNFASYSSSFFERIYSQMRIVRPNYVPLQLRQMSILANLWQKRLRSVGGAGLFQCVAMLSIAVLKAWHRPLPSVRHRGCELTQFLQSLRCISSLLWNLHWRFTFPIWVPSHNDELGLNMRC